MRKKSICFISETGCGDQPIQDPSVRYRCFHPAETLMQDGHFCTVYSAVQFYQNPCFDYDVYVFHRPNMVRVGFRDVITILRRLERRLIADYDDLIFGTADIALVSSAVKNYTLTPEKAISAFSSNLDGLQMFNRVTTSTDALAANVRKFNPGAKVAVVPNFVPESVLTLQENLGTPNRRRSPNMIGYFAGTKSHDRDFPVVEAALHRVLSENSQLSLVVVGPVLVPNVIASLPNVSTAPAVNYLRLPGLMAMCSTVIAPLEDGLFNTCKSRVKFLEAALAGCRLVASPIPDMTAIGSNHLTLAANLDDWYEALTDVPSDADRQALATRNFAFLKNQSTVDGLVSIGELQ